MNKKVKVYVSICPKCGNENIVELTLLQITKYHMYLNGKIKYIQDALPSISASEREMFITGLCEECFNKIMEEGEEVNAM